MQATLDQNLLVIELSLLSKLCQGISSIDGDKLKFILSKHNVLGYFETSKEKFLSSSTITKTLLFNKFYSDLVLVYFKDGKKIVCLLGVCVFYSYGGLVCSLAANIVFFNIAYALAISPL